METKNYEKQLNHLKTLMTLNFWTMKTTLIDGRLYDDDISHIDTRVCWCVWNLIVKS